jgi:WhiB family transcriptional regulator, redox-sensing transcriptional regulator
MLGTSGKLTGGTNAPYFDGSQVCAQVDPELFFPEVDSSKNDIKRALAICSDCEFKEPCLEFALTHENEYIYGIWGGTTPKQRRLIKQARRKNR